MRTQTKARIPAWIPWIVAVFLLGAMLRLVNLNAPPLDFHSTRQLRNALVARSIYLDLSVHAGATQRAMAASFRRAVGQYEPPIMEALVGGTFALLGRESFAVPRIYGTMFWLLGGLALFALARRFASPTAAMVSLAYFLVLPFSVQASRSFQPDPLMTVAMIAGVFFLYRWSEDQRWRWALLGAAFLGFAVLVKVVIVFVIGGAASALVLTTLGRRFWRSSQAWAMALIMAVPALAYYVLGNPSRSSEYFLAWTVEFRNLIASPHFYADWLGFVGGLVGLSLLFLSLAGTVLAPPRMRWLLLGLWIGYLCYGLVLPFQMFTHSYYHLQLVPVIALGLVPVAEALGKAALPLSRPWRIAAIMPLVALLAYESWAARSTLVAENFEAAPRFWEDVGNAIPTDADVTALTQDYGFDLMYWGWRKVRLWPLTNALSELRSGDRQPSDRFQEITSGSEYFLVTAFAQLDNQPALAEILKGYPVAAQGDGYILYDIKPAP
jgi:4-amino-4-deoxy-L-arabinose transferase-like glycosyltransferase